MFIPSQWANRVTDMRVDTEGMSAAEVVKCRADNKGLFIKSIESKYANTTYSVIREQKITRWLQGKLSVPSILDFGEEQGREFMVMSELRGTHIDDFEDKPDEYVIHLANCLKLVQSVDISDCVFDSSLPFIRL